MLNGLFTTPAYSRKRSRTQRVLTRKFWLKNRSLFMTNNFKRKCLQKLYVSSKQEKEWYGKTTPYLEQRSRHFCQHFMGRTTQQTLLAINLASQQKTKKLYFSSKVRKQFKLLAVYLGHYAVVCEMINLPCLKILQRSICKLTRDLICQSNRTF